MTSPMKLGDIAAEGRKRWAKVRQDIVAGGEDRDGTEAYQARYEAAVTRDQDPPANVRDTLQALGVTPRRFVAYKTKARGGQDAYVNYYSAEQGVIVAHWNYAEYDDAVAGKRLNYSEIIYQEYALEAARAGKPVGNLRLVVRSSLESQGTLDVLRLCLAGNLRAKTSDVDWGQDTDQFQALLTTDNVKSLPYLLVDHRNALGHKTIQKITTHGESFLVVVLG